MWAEQQHEYVRDKRGVHHQRIQTRGLQPRFADPLWEEQWYLVSFMNKYEQTPFDLLIPHMVAGV